MNPSFGVDLLGWVCQGFVTVTLMIVACKMRLFPYVVFIRADKSDRDPPTTV